MNKIMQTQKKIEKAVEQGGNNDKEQE